MLVLATGCLWAVIGIRQGMATRKGGHHTLDSLFFGALFVLTIGTVLAEVG